MKDKVKEFLKSNNYPQHVVDGGIERQLKSWENLVDDIVNKDDWYEYEYLNDIESREILHKILKILSHEEKEKYMEKIDELDNKIKPHLVFIKNSVFGKSVEKRRQLNPQINWWFYAWPKFAIDDGLVDLSQKE